MDFDTLDKKMRSISNAEKNEILFANGINYNDLPSWQKRGVGMYYKDVEKQGYNPLTNETTSCIRRSLCVEEELPLGEDYSRFIRTVVTKSER